ncbi:hypothetical protein [Methylobacterium aquaticum]|uniref:DUF7946 domain-containing protein n=1 Tax=Methylobacterium aquaticum TaxID=270351 RepID=UPI00193300E0|nr:hypothetical protein [Methylobacterium aquaticum]QRE74217.1 hypothetical protein F1D61_11905 [Methylobacterium aquaticum]
MSSAVQFSISYTGHNADHNEIEFYDVADALTGFQRYLALTTHFILNDEIIVKAPALKGARIYALPAQPGSWKFTANIAVFGTALTALAGAVYQVGTADKDTPVGNFGRSIYDYIISETVGVHVDYDKTIGEVYRERKKRDPYFPDLSQSRLDSLLEKCESSVAKMHRPIIASKTASKATISVGKPGGDVNLTGSLDRDTYDYMSYTTTDQKEVIVAGRITSYNINTFTGRIYLPAEKRPIAFTLAEFARNPENIGAIVASLSATAKDKIDGDNDIKCFVFRRKSRTERIKSIVISKIISPR